MTNVVLASESPARLRVLRAAGVTPQVHVSGVDEDAVVAGMSAAEPNEVVRALASAKAQAVADALAPTHDTLIIGCDSMLLMDGTLTGKPHTPDVARAQWQTMSGRSAHLITGHAVIRTGSGKPRHSSAHASTLIRFAAIDTPTIDAYIATGEPLQVAGAFTLDGIGGWFIDGIDGDPSSVIGIGLPTIARLCNRVGLSVRDIWDPLP